MVFSTCDLVRGRRPFAGFASGCLMGVVIALGGLSAAAVWGQAVREPALDVNWGSYTTLECQAALNPNLANPRFDTDAAGWGLPEGFSYAPNDGRNGTGGLRYEREDPALYPLSKLVVDLLPDTPYRFGAWVKTENVKGGGSGATICLEFAANDKWVGGLYAHGIKGTKDWTLIETSGATPDKPVQATLTLYMRRGMTGTAWFDDVFIEAEAPTWSVYPINPRRATLPPGASTITLGSHVVGKLGDGTAWADPAKLICRVQVLKGAKAVRELAAPVTDGRISADLGLLQKGDYTISITLADPEHQWLLAEKRLPLSVAAPPDATSAPANACRIDGKGRAWVSGKPFLPVGLYFGSIQRKDLANLGGTAFNCVMPYGSLTLKFKDSDKKGIAAAREVMDACHAQDIKVLFSVKDVFRTIKNHPKSWQGETGLDSIVTKAVQAFRDHPALLAWYICDELPAREADTLIARNQLVNRLDPHHPTWAVFYQFRDLPLYRNGFDVLGVDPYPISNEKSTSMEKVRVAMETSERAIGSPQGMPLWVVPQIFNWGVYKARNDLAKYKADFRYPTELEMRSMALYMALRGAKGFVFYSYFDLSRPPDKGQFERRWPEVCRMAKAISDLGPFLLADATAPTVTVTVAEGSVEAKAFRDDQGNVRVVIAGVGPGPSKADLFIPGHSGLASQFGNCTSLGEGRYRFEGTDICSDILGNDLTPAR